MSAELQYGVFLSHSAKDKAVVRSSTLSASTGERAGVRCRTLRFAERLRADGVKVWFDEWVLQPGDSIPAKIEEGLECSHVRVLCLSANAFGSDWAQLLADSQPSTLNPQPACDPLNKARRSLGASQFVCIPDFFSLAPGFSRVSVTEPNVQPLQRFCGGAKPLKRLCSCCHRDTRLKPGANESSKPVARN